MKQQMSLCVQMLLLWLIAQVAAAIPVPSRDIGVLVRDSGVIVVGRIVAITDSGPSSVRVGVREIAAREMVGDLEIDTVLKGPALQSLRFRFAQPQTHVGYDGIRSREHRVFFFVRKGNYYEFVNPYYTSLIALPEIELTTSEPIERVIQVVAAVAVAPRSSARSKIEAIDVLGDLKHSDALAALRRTLRDNEQHVRLSAAARLIAANDVTSLPIAEEALLRPPAGLQYGSELLDNLQVAIAEGLRDKAAVPALTRLLGASYRGVRRAAVSGLRQTQAASAIEPLGSALEDADPEIRHMAVSGLAEIAQRPDLKPSRAEFSSDPERYIVFWKDWVARRPR